MMLRLLYRALLRLRPRQWRAEMLGVFEQARADAAAHGWLAYVAFGGREIAGLLHVERGGRWRWAMGGALAGLLAAWAFNQATPEMYTSRAWIRVVPAVIPQRFVPTTATLSAESIRDEMLPVILSRRACVNVIQTFDLYRSERARMPLEDVILIFQRQVDVQQAGDNGVRASFSYPDPILAQQVARHIMTDLIDETIRQRFQLSTLTVNFLTSQAERAATAWEELEAKVRNSGSRSERLLLDTSLARRHYETLRQQVIEAEMIVSLEERKQGPTVEVVDLPSLPEQPQGSHAVILGAGAAGGLVVGLILGWLRRLRLSAPPLETATLH